MMQRQETPLTFEQAAIRAESYVGHEEKLRCLLEKATRKSEKWYEFLVAPWERLQIFLRLLRAQLAGKFRAPGDVGAPALANWNNRNTSVYGVASCQPTIPLSTQSAQWLGR
jgi:hypothetical protein